MFFRKLQNARFYFTKGILKIKKFVSLVSVVILAISSVTCVSAADEGIKVYLEGSKINFDVQPQTINDRTMVSIRAIFEAMGANVAWDDATQTAISTKDNTTVKMTLNSTTEYINDTTYTMDVTPVIINGRTLAPACVLMELNIQTADDLQAVTGLSHTAAEIRLKRLNELRTRRKFYLSPLERHVYKNFEKYIDYFHYRK